MTAPRVVHGNSLRALSGGRLGRFDVVMADPPYAVSTWRHDDEWLAHPDVPAVLTAAARSLAPRGTMFVFTAASGRSVRLHLEAVQKVLPLNRVLVWHKRFVRQHVPGPWRWNAVLILVFGRGSWGVAKDGSVFTTTNNRYGLTRHPAEVPLDVAERLWAPFAGRKGRALDPFCGSGSLLMPAASMGWEVVGVEVQERWARLASRRLKTAAGGA